MPWTDEKVEDLKYLWGEGLTAGQIAAKMGDVSRNAVIGKAHRLGLSARPSPIKNRRPKPVLISSNVCQWPIGDPGQPGFHFCGTKGTVPGKPYCQHHCSVAYRKRKGDDSFVVA